MSLEAIKPETKVKGLIDVLNEVQEIAIKMEKLTDGEPRKAFATQSAKIERLKRRIERK